MAKKLALCDLQADLTPDSLRQASLSQDSVCQDFLSQDKDTPIETVSLVSAASASATSTGAAVPDAGFETEAVFQMLPPEAIVLGLNARRTVTPQEITDLASSMAGLRERGQGIEGSGILQALLVRSALTLHSARTAPYQLICGQKRLLAARELGLPAVPCLIDGRVEQSGVADDALTCLLQLTENAQRSDPPPLEEALALRDTMRAMKLSVRDAARLLGKNKGYVENRLRLLKMAPEVQRMVSFRQDTMKHAYYLHQVADDTLRASMIAAVLQEGIGVRELCRRIAAALGQRVPSAEAVQSQEMGYSEMGYGEMPSHEAVPNEIVPVTGGQTTEGQTEGQISGQSREAASPEVASSEVASPEVASDKALSGAPLDERSPPRDYLRQNLRPAVSLLAQAARQAKGQSLTSTQRRHWRTEIGLLHRQIEALEEHLRDA